MLTPTNHHPKSQKLSFGFLQIGPKPRHSPLFNKRIISEAFRKTLSIQANPKIARLRYKLSQGTLTATEAIIGALECSLMAKAPKADLGKRGVTRAA